MLMFFCMYNHTPEFDIQTCHCLVLVLCLQVLSTGFQLVVLHISILCILHHLYCIKISCTTGRLQRGLKSIFLLNPRVNSNLHFIDAYNHNHRPSADLASSVQTHKTVLLTFKYKILQSGFNSAIPEECVCQRRLYRFCIILNSDPLGLLLPCVLNISRSLR